MIPNSRWFPLLIAAALALGACVVGALAGSDQMTQWQLAARYSARIGFPIFIITYAASSLFALWPGDATRALVRYRRQWGLGFALTHSVHLVALSGFNMIMDETPALVTFIGGGGAYAIMYVMALTSNTWSMRALGIWWKRLHRLGIHWLWFIFTFSYFGRLLEPERMGIAPLFLPIALAALGLRIAVWRKRRLVLV
jgi:DMSO/TMAO reductase YedYZ heme-binding membrane subunit